MAGCERCKTPLADDDLRCPVCGLPVPGDVRPPPAETAGRILRCEGCAAGVSYDAEVKAPKCSFCGSIMHIEQPEDPIEQAQAYLAFRVEPGAAREALRGWLGRRGFFRPADLQARATVHTLKPLWWTGWLFDADVLASWAADSDAGSRRSAWAPHAGQRELSLRNVVVPASRGLQESECLALAGAYNVRDAAEKPTEPADGTTIEQFTVQRSAARQVIARALERVATQVVAPDIPGSTYRKLHVAVLPRKLTTRRYAFPAYVLAYRYRDRLFRAIVHGQNRTVIVGDAPFSVARILLIAGLVLLVALAVLALFSLG